MKYSFAQIILSSSSCANSLDCPTTSSPAALRPFTAHRLAQTQYSLTLSRKAADLSFTARCSFANRTAITPNAPYKTPAADEIGAAGRLPFIKDL